MKNKVLILMGSQSDYPVVKKSEKVLKNLDIRFESRICSAHRQSDLMIKQLNLHTERDLKS